MPATDLDGAGDFAVLGAHAILIGTPDHVPGSELPGLPAVSTTLDDLQAALRDACGLRVQRVPADATQGEVVAAVERTVRETTGPILLCYVGHGILGPADELYLATRASRSPERIADAVPYGTLRNLLTEAPGGSVVVLDCCYSGRAKAPGGGGAQGPPPFAVTRPDGSFLLTSATWYDLSYAPEGRRHTLFGGRLVELLTQGDPAGSPWLTPDGLYEAVDRSFQGGPIRPWRQSEGTLGSLRLTRNRAYADPHPEADPPADVPCPYPGMEPFGTTQARHFFGREDLTRRLLDVVCDDRRAAQAGGTAPVVLVGQSGVGKTSLLTAGLLAGLERRHAEPAGRLGLPWPAVLLSAPGPHPLRALAEVWGRATGRPAQEVHEALSAGRLPQPRPGRERCGLLVVDQFEEIFTRCTDAEERTRFVDVLTRPETTTDPPRVVLGLRGDHYGDCLTHPGLAHALDHGLFNVRPMDDDALRAAVERPAEAAGLTLEPGLTDRLLHDLRHGGGHDRDTALPFLAHALRETWLRRSGATLTLAGYEATGGIWRAVTTTTDRLYEDLDGAEREALRELLLRLVQVTDDGVVVRRRVPVEGLLDGLSAPQRAATGAVRERLAAARLITVDQDHAQIAHEALLRVWPQLSKWIEEDRELLVQRQKLADSAREWEAGDRHQDLLLTGVRLSAAVDLLRAERLRHRRLPRTEEELVHASLAAERKQQEGLRRRFHIVVSLLCVAVIAAGVTVWQTVEANRQRNDALDQRRLGTLRALVAEAENMRQEDPQLSLRLGLAAHGIRPSAESRAAVFSTLAQSRYAGSSTDEKSVDVPVLSRDGRMEAAGLGGRIVLWDVSDAARRRQLAMVPGCGEDVDGLTFSSDGRALAGVCDNGSVVLWSLADRRHPRRTAVLTVDGLKGDPSGVAFSPDGKLLAAAGWGGEDMSVARRSLVLWSLSGDEPRQVAVERNVYDSSAVLFSPDGRTLVSSTGVVTAKEEPVDHTSITHTSGATLWDVSTPARPRRLARLDRVDESVAFSPDGRLLATHHGNDVMLWDVTDPAKAKARVAWAAHKGTVEALAFDRSGARLATTSLDDSIVVWNLEDSNKPKREVVLRGHEEPPKDVAFGRDTGTLTSVSERAVIRWNLRVPGRPEVLTTLGDLGGGTRAAVFTPDGKTLALAGWGETVTLWSMADPGHPKRLGSTDLGAAVEDLAVSADGTTLAAADRTNRITLWDITALSRPRRLSVIKPLSRPDDPHEMHLGFSPRGATLVANGGKLFTSGWAALWDVTDGAHPKKLSSFTGVSPTDPAQFSPDGELLSVPSGTDTYLFRYGSPSAEPIPVPDAYGAAAFSPDGKLLASSLGDDLLFLDVSSPEKPRKVTEAPKEDGAYQHPVFHPDGNLLATTTDSGDVRLTDIGDLSQLHRATTLSSPAEQLTMLAFSPDGRLAVTEREDSTVQIWDLRSLPALSADPIGTACKLAGGGLSQLEWARYAPGVPYKTTCPAPETS
ncbi:WD40 repeat domain-containing protein [Streptomyces sp. S.PNR 29]|uniref:WD40 repeat domain-containing protein n=1 Tax=Streptomyces sp. S.PNR 29 TaxID=2973805 RepID=UPI0025B15703|nr:WD40 repeat domain-containing protein [Streptomyces sp. S.PNR 29]MDN0196958.1 NACHT and WD repeat domain-containing protein [Streptomyces sp. S.PNR 29]